MIPTKNKHSNKSKPIIHKLIEWIDSFIEGSPTHWLNNRKNAPKTGMSDSNKSEIAKKLDIKHSGEYAIKVR